MKAAQHAARYLEGRKLNLIVTDIIDEAIETSKVRRVGTREGLRACFREAEDKLRAFCRLTGVVFKVTNPLEVVVRETQPNIAALLGEEPL